MIEIDLLLRIAIAFLKDVNLDDFKKLVYETSFLLTDINSFETDKLPKDLPKYGGIYSKIDNQQSFNIVSPRYEAETLLCFILNMNRTDLHINAKKEVSDFDKQRYFKLLAMRKNGMPLEYLTNRAYFYDMEFYVDENVLIPRTETEILVEKALDIIKTYGITNFIEVGVGSGAISLSILNNTDKTCAIATDISKKALNIAKHNAQRLDMDNRCDFVESDLLQSPYLMLQQCPLLLSNPPYIANNYPLNQEVLHEPHIALFGGYKGDEILKRLILQASERGVKFLVCEIGYDQRESVHEVLMKFGYEANFYQDYSGFDRGFVAMLTN